MSYRHNFQYNPSLISDFFSTDRYRNLLRSRVKIEDENGEVHTLDHHHFSDRRDIALGFYSDGVQLFKRLKVQKTCTPLLLTNMNLDPEIRTLLDNLICLGVIPGPHSPKDVNSFFYPAYVELLKLARGYSTVDVLAGERFILHTYIVSRSGDLPDVSKWLGYKGAGAKSPCMECEITGVRILALDDGQRASTNYYVPLKPPSTHPQPHIVWDPHDLPLRSDFSTSKQLDEIRCAPTKAQREELAKKYGLNGTSLLERFSSFSRSVSAPHDYMHLIFAHMIPMLLQLWRGSYYPWKARNLDNGQPYVISDAKWMTIGKLTAEATHLIPAGFCRAFPNIFTEHHLYISESHAAWFSYLARPLLLNAWADSRYYDHTMLLVDIMRETMDYEIKTANLKPGGTLREKIVRFVEQYYE